MNFAMNTMAQAVAGTTKRMAAGGRLALLAGAGVFVESAFLQAALAQEVVAVQPAQVGGVLAQEAPTPAAAPSSVSGGGDAPSAMEVVTVTARKTSELAQEVPMSIATVSADAMTRQNLADIKDYAARLPGVSLNARGGGGTEIVLRGITTSAAANPTTAVSIDDAPFGSSLSVSGTPGMPNLDPFDLQRVEVLRGPQGTLYGASSLGGLVKYVTVAPNTSKFSGRIQLDGSSVENGGNGHGVRAAINIPVISDSLGLRISAFERKDPGYIKDTLQNRTDVNVTDNRGGRVSAIWYANDNVTVRSSALVQESKSDASSDIDATLQGVPIDGRFVHRRLPGSDGYDKRIAFYDLSVEADLGWAKLNSVTAYGKLRNTLGIDTSAILAPLFDSIGSPRLGVLANQHSRTSKVSQEFRLDSPEGNSTWDWRAGVFYTRERAQLDQRLTATDPLSAVPAANFPLVAAIDADDTFRDAAVFGVVTYHFTPQADVQVGGRYSKNHQDYLQNTDGLLAGGAADSKTGATRESAFTYLVTPRYKVTPDLMVYATASTGYRPGGPNFGVGDVPAAYASDETRNFELGLKGQLFERKLSYAVAAYLIDWKDIQITQTSSTGVSYLSNSAKARSEGIEASFELSPWSTLSVTGNAVLSKATLSEDLPDSSPSIGRSGDRLPFSAKRTASITARQTFVLAGNKGNAGAAITYVGDRDGNFAQLGDSQRVNLPSYTTIDLFAGVDTTNWRFSAFVKNAADRYGYLGSTAMGSFQAGLAVLQPRTVGLSIARTF